MTPERPISFVRLHWFPYSVTVGVMSFVLGCIFVIGVLAGSALHGEAIGGSIWSSTAIALLIAVGVVIAVVSIAALPFACLARKLQRERGFPFWLPVLLAGPLFCLLLLLLGNILFALLGGFIAGCGASVYWLILYFRSRRLPEFEDVQPADAPE